MCKCWSCVMATMLQQGLVYVGRDCLALHQRRLSTSRAPDLLSQQDFPRLQADCCVNDANGNTACRSHHQKHAGLDTYKYGYAKPEARLYARGGELNIF